MKKTILAVVAAICLFVWVAPAVVAQDTGRDEAIKSRWTFFRKIIIRSKDALGLDVRRGDVNIEEDVTIGGVLSVTGTISGDIAGDIVVDDGITFPEESGDPAALANNIKLYAKDKTGVSTLYYIQDDSNVVEIGASGAGDNTLNDAYDEGGAGAGAQIDVTDGPVILDNTEADNADILQLSHVPVGAASGDGLDVTMGANATGNAIEIANSGSGYDIEGSAVWSVSKAGDGVFNDVTCATLTPTTLYIPDIDAASAGNVALTIDAAGSGTVTIQSVGTGLVSMPGANLDIGDAVTDSLSITSSVDAELHFDDGVTDSPALTFVDASNEETQIYQDNTTADLVIEPNDAAEGVRIATGNFAVGNGVPSVAMNGEDAYVEGTFEVDGATQFDGAMVVNSTVQSTGGLNLDEEFDMDCDANDEEFHAAFTAADYAADSALATIYNSAAAGQTNATYGLRIRNEADGDAQDHFLIMEDNDGDDLVAFNSGGEIIITPDATKYVTVNANTSLGGTDNTSTDGVIQVYGGSVTDGFASFGTYIQGIAGGGGGGFVNGYTSNVDDDTDAANTISAFFAAISDNTGSSKTVGYYVGQSVGVGFDYTMWADLSADMAGITIDAATSVSGDYGVTTGLLDLDVDTATNGFTGLNIDVDWIDPANAAIATGIYVDLDDDDTADASVLDGVHIIGSDLTGNAVVTAYKATTVDCALAAINGYVSVGAVAGADVTPGDNDIYIVGTSEFDGAMRVDGAVDLNANLTGSGSTEMVGMVSDTVDAGATNPYAVTCAMSGTIFYNSQAVEFDLPDASTCPGAEFTFVVEHASNLDIDPDASDTVIGLCNAAGDKVQSAAIGDTITFLLLGANTVHVKATNNSTNNADSWADAN